MLAKVWSAAVNGIDAYNVEIEVDSGFGDTNTIIVGLPNSAVKESRDHVSAALANTAFKSPQNPIEPTKFDLNAIFNAEIEVPLDFADVKGQETVKRPLEIAAAGGHNVLIS